jgi:hypothetical protein
MRVNIKPCDVRVGDVILIDPTPKGEQENPYHEFLNMRIKVEEIVALPTGGFYFIYGGDQRDSIFVAKEHTIYTGLKNILEKL